MSEQPIKPVRLITCPTCRAKVVYDTANPFRPFCSARCKNEDIIAWASDGYKVPGKSVEPGAPDDDEEA